MMNWKDSLNYLKLSIKHIIKPFQIALFISISVFSQNDSNSTQPQNVDSAFIPSKSPLTAVLMSAIIPGAGQIYNESYWKAPLIWGISGWLIYNWIDNNKLYKSYADLYNVSQNENFRRLRNFYRDQRDLFSIYMGLTYVMNLVDAYVDAQLFDFTVEEDFFIRQPRLRINFYFR